MSDGRSSAGTRRLRFEEIIAPELGFLARTASSMSRSAAEAEDLAQDAVLKAFAALDRFDGQYPRAWLFRITRNTAISRDARRRDVLVDEDAELDLHASDSALPSGPEEIVVDSELDDLLERALDELPPAFRVIVDLVDAEGMRYQEVADLLDIPVGTVMSRLHRARARLRSALTGTHLDRR